MKKILVAALLLTGTGAYAQSFQLGLKGGVNLSNYSGTNFETSTMAGFHLGGLLNFKLGEVFSIQPEVLFSTQGAQYKNATTKSNLKVSYVNIPVMAKLLFGGLYVEAGPQVGFKASEDANIPNQTINQFARNLDLSVGAGIGYQSKGGLGIGARYVAGVSKVGDFNKTTTLDPEFRNSLLQISLFLSLIGNK